MRRFCYIILFLFFHIWAQAQPQPFTKDYWLNESGAPVKVNALIIDKAGYIFAGTDAGAYRFNGRSFYKLYDTVKKTVTALQTINGEVWVGYAGGTVGTINGDTVQIKRLRGNIPAGNINGIAKGLNNTIVLCTENGLYILLNDFSVKLDTKNGLTDNYTYAAGCVSDKMMLVGTDQGISTLNYSNRHLTLHACSLNSNLPDNIINVLKLVNNKRTVWIGTQQGGVGKISYNKDMSAMHVDTLRGWQWGQVNDILPTDEKKIWVAAENGMLVEITGEKMQQVHVYSLKGKNIYKLIQDPSGNIWCATNQGLTMLTTQYLTNLKLDAPYSLHALNTVLFDKKDVLWFAENENLYRLVLYNGSLQPEKMFKAPSPITCIYAGKHDDLYVGTFGNGLWHMTQKAIMPVKNIANVDIGNILDINGNGNNIWIASLNGIERTVIADSQGNLTWVAHYNKASGIGSDYVYQLYPDKKDRMWLATDGGGIAMYDGTAFRRWDTSAGFYSKVVYSICEDSYGQMWAGSYDKGLYCLKDNKWYNVSLRDGLQDINISAIDANATGQVIIVNQKGIDEWYPDSKQFRRFNRRSIRELDSVSKVLNCIATDTDGNVFVPYRQGFIVFKNLYESYDIRPRIALKSVSMFLKPLPIQQNRFSYDENYITFSFDGINYLNMESMKYRYRLKGYSNAWIRTNDESVTFPLLLPGHYTFTVQCSLNEDFTNARSASYSFIILTPFWKQLWFISCCVLMALLLIYLYIRIREKRLRNTSKLQRERMIYEYEHLKTQVNPHFLFNSLNTLMNLIDDNNDNARDYTRQLSDLYRHMLSYRDKDLILLSEEWEIFKSYMYIQQSRFGKALTYISDVPQHIMQTKKIIPLALQLVVENAIKHNVISNTKPLTIYITATESELTVVNKMQPKLSKEKSAGLGLTNISSRYSLLSKKKVTFGVFNNEFIVKLPLL